MPTKEFKMLDITAPEGDVEFQIRHDSKVIWVNVEGCCALRVCRISGNIIINDLRQSS